MIRRKLVWGLVWVGAVCALTFGCGNVISTTTPTVDTGGLVVLVSDTPVCNVLAYHVSVNGMILRSVSEGNAANVFKGVVGPSISVNFGGLRDTTSILRVAPVTVGTYDQVEIGLVQPLFTFYDPTKANLIGTVTPILPGSSEVFNIQSPLIISKGEISALRIDLDVRHSVAVNQQGNLVGASAPALTVTPVTADSQTGFGRLQDMRGFVLSVTSGSALSQFLGSINVQFHSGITAVPQLPVNITSSTKMINADHPDGIRGTDPGVHDSDIKQIIAGILGGSFVEVDGYVDPKGNLVADTVQVEDQEDVTTRRVAMIGTITGVTRDLAGNASHLNLYIAETQPESAFVASVDSVMQVDLAPTTKFNYSSRAVNFASLPFDATNLAVGQQIIVHGPSFTGTVNNQQTVDAESIYLKLQTHDGTFSSLVNAGSDDRTGAFWLKPCCTIFSGNPMLVFTNNETSFVNLVGLSGLTPQPDLVIKGLLYYEPQSVTINGVTVPAGTIVMLADQVHQVT
jgi:Domain of unknown function (DUF4382)